MNRVGKVPQNMSVSWRFLLQRNLPPLPNLQFAVFGFGDSSYEKFNAAARKLFTRLQQLQARPILPMGLGDDQQPSMYLQSLDEWTQTLLRQLKVDSTPNIGTETLFRVDWLPSSAGASASLSEDFVRSFKDLTIHPELAYLQTTVSANERLTQEGWEPEVRLVTFALPTPIPYKAGDVAIVYPHNPPDIVDRALRIFGLQGNLVVSISRCQTQRSYGNLLSDVTCTVSDLFKYYLDVGGRPRRSFFESMAALASDSDERAKLLEMCSPSGCDLFAEYCLRESRSYIEVLEEFPSARPSLSRCLAMIPTLRPRYFSIASSGRSDPRQLQLCVGRVLFRTPYKRIRRGKQTPPVNTIVSSTTPRIVLQLYLQPGNRMQSGSGDHAGIIRGASYRERPHPDRPRDWRRSDASHAA